MQEHSFPGTPAATPLPSQLRPASRAHGGSFMEKRDEELILSLVAKDPELRRHYDEHADFERQLERFNSKAHLSAEEEIERKRLQKLKLAGKDRIMEILGRHRGDATTHH
jgi:uncharacterized protein YdcH (DUF465 family)